MALSKTLIELAMISPASYANKIRTRNLALRSKLMLLKPYIGMKVTCIPDDIDSHLRLFSHNGCPHCSRSICHEKCNECLWRAATHRGKSPFGHMGCFCVYVKYNGYNLKYVSNKERSVIITYGPCSERIELGQFDNILTQKEWDECMAFIDGHIEWAELDCWGAKYKKVG